MSQVVNTVHSDRFQHLDASGSPVTGLVQANYSTHVATLTASDGTVLATVAISIVEQSGGWYGTFWTPTAVGNWTEEIVYSAVSPPRRWSGPVEVLTAAQADPVAALGAIVAAGSVSYVGPVAVSGAVTIVLGDDYAVAETRALSWSTTNAGTWPDLTGAAITLHAVVPGQQVDLFATGSVVTPTGANKVVRAEVARDQVARFANDSGTYPFRVKARFANDHVATLVDSTITIKP